MDPAKPDPLKTITLTFPDAVNLDDLQEMISFEVKPLPGVGDSGGYRLTKRDYAVKELDRTSREQQPSYRLTFNSPIGYGKHVDMHLKLSLSEKLEGSLATYYFQTKRLIIYHIF